MSAKLLHTLSDENPDLQKQIGCMNGIFQLFDRNHFLGSRRIIGHNQKRLPAGPGQSGSHVREAGSSALQKTMEKNVRAMKEKQRVSTESSRTSFSSSSCSSSFSSAEYGKTSQLEPASLIQTIYPETPSLELSLYQSNASPQLSLKSVDLRDVVKDSIHREARGVLIRTAKEEAGYQNLRYIDSPRPLQQPKSARTNVSGLNKSFRVLPRLRDAAWNSNEGKDSFLNEAPKENRRFSYDGRESREGLKSTIKLKELPRLSLDSRERSIRSSNADMKSGYVLQGLHRENGISNNLLNQQQDPGSYRRPSSVVAKLMGLELLPDWTNHNQTREIESYPDVGYDPVTRFSAIRDDNNQNWFSGSPRHSHKEPTSPRPRNAGSIKKPIASSKFPLEPAPWRHPDGSNGRNPAPESPKKVPSSLSVYGEIEKRLTQLEFKKSGKDLRALKQILEAMQKTKEKLDSRQDHALDFVSQTSNANGLVRSSNNQISTITNETHSVKSFRSPIVIMKPAKLVGKASDSASVLIRPESMSGLSRIQTSDSKDNRKEITGKRIAKNLNSRPNNLSSSSGRPLHAVDKNTTAKTLRSTKISKETQPIAGENSKSGKGSGNVSLRLQQKELASEKLSRPSTPSSDLSKTRRQPTRHQMESGSPRRKPRARSPKWKQTEDQLTDPSSDMRDLSHLGDFSSLQSESNMSFTSNADTEVTSIDRSDKFNGNFSEQSSPKQKNPDSRYNEDKPMVEPARVALEQPSPVSVLDATFYRDESPSPVKRISNAFKDEEPLNSEEAEWITEGLSHLSSYEKPCVCSENDHRKAEIFQSLIEDLMHFNRTHEIDETIAVYDSMNPDHKYILEILSASGLLRDQGHSKLGPSGLPISPNLFLVLEHHKPNARDLKEKVQRKLVFDTVNEILAQKLSQEWPSKQLFSSSMLADRRPRGQQLMKSLCSEIDRLQANTSNCSLDDEDDCLRSILWEDLIHESTGWTDCPGEISGLVLDVERLIFKDLISEVVNGEVAAVRGRPGGHCRQLFSK